jgi:hypothetical protein
MNQPNRLFPLSWPVEYPRTLLRRRSDFKTDFVRARMEILIELRRMGVAIAGIEISTNCPVIKKTGLPGVVRPQLSDPGVAVYFQRKNKPYVLACDKWDRIEDNMHAIALTTKAMRGMERWGVTQMLERAISGFEMIEAPKPYSFNQEWFEVLGVSPSDPLEKIEQAYKRQIKQVHPDLGGSHELSARLNWALGFARSLRKAA